MGAFAAFEILDMVLGRPFTQYQVMIVTLCGVPFNKANRAPAKSNVGFHFKPPKKGQQKKTTLNWST